MTSTTLTTGRRFALLATAAAMLFAMLPAAPSQADAQAVAVAGTAHLTKGFNNAGTFPDADGCFKGSAEGTLSGSVTADFTYNNSPATGDAAGDLDLPGSDHDVSFTWLRVGANAVLTLSNSDHSGNAVATFAPVASPSLDPPTACTGDAAQVVGVGVLS